MWLKREFEGLRSHAARAVEQQTDTPSGAEKEKKHTAAAVRSEKTSEVK